MSSILLVSPPLFKACEPPASLAFLAGALPEKSYEAVDMNIEGQLWLLQKNIQQTKGEDTWSKRAIKNGNANIQQLQQEKLYNNFARYKQVIHDANKLFSLSSTQSGLHLSFSDYQSEILSPLVSDDLLFAAENFSENIFFPFFSTRCNQIFQNRTFDWVGISLNFLSQALTAFALIGWLKKNYPQIKIVVGGGLATTWSNHRHWQKKSGKSLQQLALFTAGSGEEFLPKLLGIAPREPACPDYNWAKFDSYLAPTPILPYTTSRGCFWRQCSFCPETAEKSRYIHTPPQTSLQQLHTLCAAYQPGLVHFLDNALSNTTLRALTAKPLPAHWYGFARFDPPLDNLHFCKQLKQAGCIMLKLGLESGDQQVLNTMKKGIQLKRAERILNNLKEAGIATYVYLLFGTPAEDEKAAFTTLEYVAAHSELISYLNLAIFNMPQLSPEIAPEQRESFNEKDLSIYTDFIHPKGWRRQDIRHFLGKHFRKHPNITPILQRNPPFFGSNHAPFFSTLTQKHRNQP